MKKLNRVAALFALAAIVSSSAMAQVATGGDNWRANDGTVWKNGTNELCWRDANWTPATAAIGCDGAPKPAPVVAAPKPVEAPKPVAATPPSPPPAPKPVVTTTKVTYNADAFFDFDKAVLKPAGKEALDDLVAKSKDINLEVMIAVGFTDWVGSEAYNQKLSVRRAEAVKAYLVEKGVEKNRVYTEGKGKKDPVADNHTAAGRAKNRRVQIEIVGTKTVTTVPAN